MGPGLCRSIFKLLEVSQLLTIPGIAGESYFLV